MESSGARVSEGASGVREEGSAREAWGARGARGDEAGLEEEALPAVPVEGALAVAKCGDSGEGLKDCARVGDR